MKQENQKPPRHARRISRVSELPPHREPATYEFHDTNNKTRLMKLANRKRQVMDLLIATPIHCASPVRLSDVVHILKRETAIEVETKMYPGDPRTGSGDYGVYFLVSDVRKLKNSEAGS